MKWSGYKSLKVEWTLHKICFNRHEQWLEIEVGYVGKFKRNEFLGPVHTETFPCVFVLFTVLKEIENNQLIDYLKQYKNAGKRFRVYGALIMYLEIVGRNSQILITLN